MSCADANTGVSASPITKSHFMGDKLARSAYQFLEHPRSIEPNVRYANIRPQDRLTELAIARSTKALTAPKSFAADLEPVTATTLLAEPSDHAERADPSTLPSGASAFP